MPTVEERYTTSVSATSETSNAIVLPQHISPVTVAVIITSGTADVEYSTSSIANIIAGTANWRSWENGTVSADDDDVIVGAVNAVRLVATSGTSEMEILGSAS